MRVVKSTCDRRLQMFCPCPLQRSQSALGNFNTNSDGVFTLSVCVSANHRITYSITTKTFEVHLHWVKANANRDRMVSWAIKCSRSVVHWLTENIKSVHQCSGPWSTSVAIHKRTQSLNSGFPLFWTDKIPWYFHDFSRFFSKFPGIFSLFLKYDFQVVLIINMQTYRVSLEQKINHFNYTPN